MGMTLREYVIHQRLRHTGLSSFRQNGNYLPKEKNQVKKDWRDFKQFKQAKKFGNWCQMRVYLKNYGNRRERRWAKKQIKAQRYDNIWFKQDHFVSRWDAC